MNLTIEMYIDQIYRIKKEVDPNLKHDIDVIHSEIVNRMNFEIPIYHVKSYNLNSCIVPINNNIYHIVDHSIFDNMMNLISAFKYEQPNYGIFIYNLMRHDICMESYNDEKAELYKQKEICVTEYDIYIEELRMNHNQKEAKIEFSLMVKFYFLHEYMHYLYAKPIRDSNSIFFDNLIEMFTDNMLNGAKEIKDNMLSKMFLKYLYEFKNNPYFREEILCDLQSVCCLLELSIYYEVDTIFYSIIEFIYTQYFIWLAKRNDTDLELGNIFHFRINVMIQFAYFLEDNEFSNIMCKALNMGNRYINLQNLKCKQLKINKFNVIYNVFKQMLYLDKMGKSTLCIYTGGFGSDFIIGNIKPNTTYVSSANDNGFIKQLYEVHHNLEQCTISWHIEALSKSEESPISYIDHLSRIAGGLSIKDIEKYNVYMFRYIKNKYPTFFIEHSELLDKATTTTLFVWENEGRVFI